jgi:hypothetical protein
VGTAWLRELFFLSLYQMTQSLPLVGVRRRGCCKVWHWSNGRINLFICIIGLLRKYRSAFDPYSPYVLKRWQEGEHSGRQLWREVRFQEYSGSERMVYRFLETLKTTEIVTSAGTHRLPHYTSRASVLQSFAQGVEQDKAAVQAGLTLPISNESFLLRASLLWEVYLTQLEEARLHLERKTEDGSESVKSRLASQRTFQLKSLQVRSGFHRSQQACH